MLVFQFESWINKPEILSEEEKFAVFYSEMNSRKRVKVEPLVDIKPC